MLDLQTLIFKFGLPGLPLSFILVFKLLLNPSSGNVTVPDITLLTLVLSLLVGYMFQQIWHLFFESTWLRYDNGNRKVLVWLKKYLSDKKNASARKKWNIIDDSDLTTDKLYAIWESLLYVSDTTKLAIDKLRSIWNYYHSNMAISLGLITAAVAYPLLAVQWYPQCPILFPIVFIICAGIIWWKAWVSRKNVDNLERNWAEEFIQKIESKPTKK